VAKTAETFAKIGWQAQMSLREGLTNTVDWYRSALEHSPEFYKASLA
jgi:dTDP-D-glucose 4,6-dehydratase